MSKIRNRPNNGHSAVALASLTVLIALSSQAASAPQIPQFRNDPQRTGRTTYECPRSPTLSWTYNIGAACSATPVVAQNGTVYFGAYDKIFSAVTYDGTRAWSFTANAVIKSSAAIGADGSMYFGTALGAIYALREDGSPKWPTPFIIGGSPIAGPPLIAPSGTIYFAAENRNVYALSDNGSLLWNLSIGATPRYGLSASPDGSVIYVPANDGCVYAINSNGSLRWKSANVYAYNICAVGDDGIIYVGGSDYKLYAINPNGTIKWSYAAMGKISTAATVGHDGSVYFGSQDRRFYALKPDGTLKWAYNAQAAINSPPILDPFGTVLFGADSGDLVAANAQDGSVIWNVSLGSSICTSPVVAADGAIYVIDSGGVLSKFAGRVTAVPEPSTSAGCLSGLALWSVFIRRLGRKRPYPAQDAV